MHMRSLVISPEPERIRLLVMGFETELLRASLPCLAMMEARALPTLLEGLALAFQQHLYVVLVADDQVGSSCGATFEALVETRPLFYEVGIAAREAGELAHHAGTKADGFLDLQSFRGVAR